MSGGVPAGIRSGTSEASPSDSRLMTTRPSSSASPSTAIRSTPSISSNATLWRSSSIAVHVPPAPVSRRRRRKTSGLWCSSSSSSAASIRPATATKRVGPASARARARAMGTNGVAAISRPTRPRGPSRRMRIQPAASSAMPARTRRAGITPGMIAVGVRASDPGEINSPKEPTRRVGVEVIAAVSIARPLRAGIPRYGTRRAGSTDLSTLDRPLRGEVVHRPSTGTRRGPEPVSPCLVPFAGRSPAPGRRSS